MLLEVRDEVKLRYAEDSLETVLRYESSTETLESRSENGL